MYLQVSLSKYLQRIVGNSRVSSRKPIVKQAYDGANFVSLAVPLIRLYNSLSNKKLLFSRTNFADSMMKSFEKRIGIKSLLFSIQYVSASRPRL